MDVEESSVAEAPPQPPVQREDALPPPIVSEIGSSIDGPPATAPLQNGAPDGAATDTGTVSATESDAVLLDVPSADLASFGELIVRFETRIDKAATGRKYKALRSAWDEAVSEISRFPDRVDLVAVADAVLTALRIGCESAKVAVVDSCLDCIHRLFEYGHLGGAGESTQLVLDERESSLEDIVAIVCGCLEVKEEEVYLRMVQTLLTAATSTRRGLHHGTLLAAVRTIYNIYLNAKLPGTRTTARVSLTQILNLVFTRMEAEAAEDSSLVVGAASDMPSAHMDAEAAEDPSRAFGAVSDMSSVTSAIVSSTLSREPSEESNGVHYGIRRNSARHGKPNQGEDSGDFSSMLQKDAYLLFRALCKLSAKDLDGDSWSESVALRSKLLSLELLRGLVGSSGPAFRSGDRFIYALRHYLAPSLLTNCMSSAMEVVDQSLDIFDMLLRKETLRPLLKTEIGAFFDTALFRFLESPSAGAPRRRRALAILNRLSSDRQTLADLFLNYDCDMESSKIFERVVSVLASSAEHPGATVALANGQSIALSNSEMSSVQEEELQMAALSSIVHVLASLRDWSKPLEDAKGDKLAVFSQTVSGDDAPYSDKKLDADRNENNLQERDMESSARNGDRIASVKLQDSHEARSTGGLGTASAPAGGGLGGSVLGTVSEGNDQDTSRFEQTLKAKRATEQGILLFNSKPKKGVDFLIENGRLDRDPVAVATFLMRAESLDATMVGEYIGDGDAFCVSVMHAYTDLVDMSDMTFDNALRKYLSGFRLPGEAQKIDRIMEKFSSRYCDCSPGSFANAETAFILSYSTIMLHTDAHNPMVRKKMTKEEFVRNNRGINDGGDLPYDVLCGLYDRITTVEFRLSANLRDSAHEAATAAMTGNTVSSVSIDQIERARLFKEESDKLMVQSKILFANRRKTTEDYTYFSASNVYHARLMFEAAWYAVLAAISVLLEKASPSDTTTVALCLEGFRNGIAIASTFGMGTTKNAFVSSLAKFTHLNSVSEMRAKNVECVRMILAIAAMEGDNLGDQWVVIVRAISQVEQIRAVASGNPRKYILPKMPLGSVASSTLGIPDDTGNSHPSVSAAVWNSKGNRSPASSSGGIKGVVGNGTASLLSGAGAAGNIFGPRRSSSSYKPGIEDPSSSPAKASGGIGSSNGLAGAVAIGKSNGERGFVRIDSKAATVATLIDESEIERIFINSSQLSSSGVADFCSALCFVSLEELSEANGPRLFCLQKIVEMAYYNMESRTRIQWAKIWEHMGPFFVSAMCHDNRDVAMYSIDSLRQLASKFLEKDELSNFSFQRSFLKPFEQCFARSKSVPVRELVLTCVSQIVLARAVNIKSGWKSVFAVLALAADDKNESVMNFGFQVVESIVRKYLGEIDDVFVHAVTGIAAYTRSPLSSSVALSAIDLLTEKCAFALAEGAAVVSARPVDSNDIPIDPAATGEERLVGDDATYVSLQKNLAMGRFSADVEAHIGTWFPILTGLASSIQDERPNIRLAASKGLFKVLSDYGGRFTPGLWEIIFKGVVSPMFDDVRHLSTSDDRAETTAVAEWASSIGSASLRALVDVTVQHLDVTRIILPDLLELMRSWIVQETENVAREGMAVLARLVKTAGDLMIAEDWQLIIDLLRTLFLRTMPHEILGPDRQQPHENNRLDSKEAGVKGPETNVAAENGGEEIERKSSDAKPVSPVTKIDFRVVRAKCVVQLLLIQLVQDAVVSFYLDLSTEHILALASSVETSYSFAHDFNADIELRFSLWRTGFMNQVPNLLKQETTGLTAYLRIIFWLYLDESKGSEASAEPKLIALCSRVLNGFVLSCEEARSKPEEKREVDALIPVVTFIVNGMMQMSTEQFEKHLPTMYHLLLNLSECADDRLVRSAVCNLLRARIGPMLGLLDESGNPATPFVPKPQVPGRVRERSFLLQGTTSPLERGVATEVQSTLSKVSGVRSAFVNTEDSTARVFTSAPDELLVASIAGVPGIEQVELLPDASPTS
jgi:brefeldin A-inhibited guanine nucleotide-exchange protein